MPGTKIVKIDKAMLKDLLGELVEDSSELTRLVEIFDADRVQRYLRIFDLDEEGERERLTAFLKLLMAELAKGSDLSEGDILLTYVKFNFQRKSVDKG